MIQAEFKKRRDSSWDFRGANTKGYTHCFHSYPAMMIPQVAGRILDEFGGKAKLLFDPYCGTGTSLVEANLRGISAIGTDINPLARLIAKVKTTVIPLEALDAYLKDFYDFAYKFQLGALEVHPKIPRFPNIDYWFSKDTQFHLAVIREYVDKIKDKKVQDFFKVALSETARQVSLTRKGEFKLHRMPPRQMEKFHPDVFSTMVEKLERNREGMKEYIARKKNCATSQIYDFNTVKGIPEDTLPPGSVDLVLTSPPYGDSRTTVAYGQFSRLSSQWLGFEEAHKIDQKCMGGVRKKEIPFFGCPFLDEVLAKLVRISPQRAYDVASFYLDYERSIRNVSRVVKRGGVVAYVVGNRRVKGFEIQNDEITREFFERNGFEHLQTVIREIPSKRMPRRNSPSNKTGFTETTMNYEYIVVLRKCK